MPGKSGRRLIFWGRVLYAHSTISSKLSGFAASAIWPTLPPGHAARRGPKRDCQHWKPPTSRVIGKAIFTTEAQRHGENLCNTEERKEGKRRSRRSPTSRVTGRPENGGLFWSV